MIFIFSNEALLLSNHNIFSGRNRKKIYGKKTLSRAMTEVLD